MYQRGLYLHDLKKRIAYHQKQLATWLEAIKTLEKEQAKLQVDKENLQAKKKSLEKEANSDNWEEQS